MLNNGVGCAKNVGKQWIKGSKKSGLVCVNLSIKSCFGFGLCKILSFATFCSQSLYTYFHKLIWLFSSVIQSLFTQSTRIYNYYYKIINYIIEQRSGNEVRN
jgi:hypothetical protein